MYDPQTNGNNEEIFLNDFSRNSEVFASEF